jgi:hypothetical protein
MQMKAMAERAISHLVRITGVLVLLFAAGCSAPSRMPSKETVQGLLSAYSTDLSTGAAGRDSMYSRGTRALIAERRRFYDEFFLNALHSDLTSISSTYDIRSISGDPEEAGRWVVRAAELLTFKAKYRLEDGGDPIVRAAAWALERTDNPAVKAELRNLASMHEAAAHKNATEGYDTSFVLEHTLLVVRQWNGLHIIEDAYTDANPQDNPEGTDVIEWKDGTFSRKQPDYSGYPDYSMYHTSIEQLGQSLLNDYSK